MAGTVLVTGATGYVASHVVRVFLEAGYNVKCSVRSANSGDGVKAAHPGFADRLSFAILDVMDAAAFTEAAKGVVGIIHTASPFFFDVKDAEKELLEPAKQGTLNALAAAASNPSVRRVVITSSFAAIVDMAQGYRPGYTYSEKDWNPATVKEAKETGGAFAYCASKGLSEKAAWEWMEAKKPAFSLATICPPWILGPSVNSDFNMNKLSTSISNFWNLINGSAKEVPATDFAGSADVRDVAFTHLKAFQVEEAGGQRFLVGIHYDYQTAVDELHTHYPKVASRAPVGKPGAGLLEEVYAMDGTKATTVLGLKYTPLAKTLKDVAEDLLSAEGKAASAKA